MGATDHQWAHASRYSEYALLHEVKLDVKSDLGQRRNEVRARVRELGLRINNRETSGKTVLTLSLPSSNSTFSYPFKKKCISDEVRIGSIIIFHLSKLWKAKFSILCNVIFLVRLHGKFEIDHSCK